MSRITLNDTSMDVVVKMSEGNPGAMTAIMQIMSKAELIDPQAFMGGLGTLMNLDTWGIYGTEIYVLFSDKCGRDLRKMLVLLRATQLGLFSVARLKELAADQMYQVNLTDEEWENLDNEVCEQLQDFARPEKQNA